jgi:16S rRNA (cytidine1402-2'-O)-methyltransferase
MNLGCLYLIPVPLGPNSEACLPDAVVAKTLQIDDFVVENLKTARAVLKALDHPTPLREIRMAELNEHTAPIDVPALLEPTLLGRDLGLMSEAGCPAVADPGSALVEHAHRRGIRVVPLVGPSSILLALMASGMNGQRFAFHGYLPARDPERFDALKKLEIASKKTKSVEIFIETPYRNAPMFESCLRLADTTRLCVACDLTQPGEWIRSASIRDWKARRPEVDLDRRPAVFLIQSS